ncbi:hypothetical protein ABGB08_50915 [Acrocarpospora sp. B8E8]
MFSQPTLHAPRFGVPLPSIFQASALECQPELYAQTARYQFSIFDGSPLWTFATPLVSVQISFHFWASVDMPAAMLVT